MSASVDVDGQPMGPFDGRSIGSDDFNFISRLGSGVHAEVVLAETKTSKEPFAIKAFKKELLVDRHDIEGMKVERDILVKATRAKHPFVVQFHAAFQTDDRLYFVLEYLSGGDLGFHIQTQRFSQERARFYGAEICLALKYFHEHGILYRDMKLGNILIAPDGHVKIIDFGASKTGMDLDARTSSFVGTVEFMAPEMLLDRQYGYALDWWNFGILMYQMVCGQSPFVGEDVDKIFDAILQDEPVYPADVPPVTASFLQKLLTREPELRLGSGGTDAEEVMEHEYFAGIDWDDLYHKRVSAPFVPASSNDTDTSNFDPGYTSQTPMLEPVHAVLSQAVQDEFRDFSSNSGE